MGTSLNGLTPANTYQALIKVGNNTNLNTTLKTLSDGAGNDLPMQASTTAINFTGTVSGVASGVSGAIQFSNGSAFASDANNLFWDDTNNRLGIGTNAPSATAHLKGSGTTSGTTALLIQNSAAATALEVKDNLTVGMGGAYVSGASGFGISVASITASYPCFLMNQTAGATSKVGFNLETAKLYFSEETNGTTLFGHRVMVDTRVGGLVVLNNTAAGVTASLNASAVLQADSTTRGFLPPRMTTTQKNAIASPAAGLQVFDSTMNATCEYTGTAWRVVSAGAQAVTVTGLLQTVSLANGNVLDITLNSTTTFTFTNPTIGTYILKLTQGVGGGFLVNWPVNVIWSGGTAPTLSTTAGKIDIITLIYDGTSYYGNYSLNY